MSKLVNGLNPDDVFLPAVRSNFRIVTGFGGPGKSGKTVAALRYAGGLVGAKAVDDPAWSKVFVIDTDDSNALAYVNSAEFGIGQFMHAGLRAPYHPSRFLLAGQLAVAAGAEVVIWDSLSLAWDGPGGFRDLHEEAGGTFRDYQTVNPYWNGLVDFIVRDSGVHSLVTLRYKVKSEQVGGGVDEEGRRQRSRVREIGLEPVIRPGFVYELRALLVLDQDSHEVVSFNGLGGMAAPAAGSMVDQALGAAHAAWANAGEGSVSEAHSDRLGDAQATRKAIRSGGGSRSNGSGSGKLAGDDMTAFWSAIHQLPLARPERIEVGQSIIADCVKAGSGSAGMLAQLEAFRRSMEETNGVAPVMSAMADLRMAVEDAAGPAPLDDDVA